MRLLNRYLGWAVLLGTLLTLFLLVSVHALIDFVDELNQAGDRGLTFVHALVMTGLTVPRRVYELFPTAVLLGGLLGLGSLAAHNELMVIRASGVSVLRLVRSVLSVGVLMALLAFVIGEFLVPLTEHQVETIQNVSKSGRISTGGRYGMWAKDGDRLVNIGVVYPDLRLEQVRIFELADGVRLTRVVSAQTAVFENNHWVVRNVVTNTLGEASVTTDRSAEERWDRLISPDLFDVLEIEPHKMSARTLYHYIRYLDENELDSNSYKLAFWGHFTVPLSAVFLLALSIPFVFGSMRSAGAGQRLFIGLLIGIVFHLGNQAVNNMGLVYGMPPLVVAVLPLLILSVAAGVALRRLT